MITTFHEADIRSAIEKALDTEFESDPKRAFDIAFHMTDWLGDLQRLCDFYQNPDKTSSSEIDDILRDFLIHVPNHVAAAGVLLNGTPVSDVFQVGAVEASK